MSLYVNPLLLFPFLVFLSRLLRIVSPLALSQVIKGSTKIYVALFNSCIKQNRVAICRLIPRQTAGPTFVALQPHEPQPLPSGLTFPGGFYVIPLPFADDMRDLEVSRGIAQPNEDEQKAMTRLAKSLIFKNFTVENFQNPGRFC